MKNALLVLGVAGLLLGLVRETRAHVGGRIYPFYELTDEDLAVIDLDDGSIEDWLEVVGEPSLKTVDFTSWEADFGIGFADPSDLDFRIWLAWHDATDRIYVAMERVDDVYTNDFVRNDFFMWAYDSSFSFTVDGDHSGGEYHVSGIDSGTKAGLEEWLFLNMQQAQQYAAIAEVFDDAPQITIPEPGQFEDWFCYPPYAHAGGGKFSENPIITVTEAYFTPFDQFVWNSPDESLVSELYAGKVIGFVMGISDSDEDPMEPHLHFRLPERVGADSELVGASTFADGMLLGVGEKIPENTAVQDVTWARIKASFAK